MFEHVIQSPVGPLTLTGTEDALTRLSFGGGQAGAGSPSPALELAARELEEYFAGVRREFTVPLAPVGTAFQLAVWSALREIPYGATASYRDIAVRLGKPGGAVAVGQANSRNPIPIIIPCHRIIGAGGQLVGYTGGLEIKRFLLRLEERLPG
ncbi:MAG: methylated-DNA--[protein]-cysteine S-methyltransferase [Oscillospiraceae bacterium]|jgi:methylated-DNA-[protein]-cysteine S-methyltransferase|nr:methylated-DNA--[protein]-cysteine S-methyltransferase [Oscillospiraceae bacterium]